MIYWPSQKFDKTSNFGKGDIELFIHNAQGREAPEGEWKKKYVAQLSVL